MHHPLEFSVQFSIWGKTFSAPLLMKRDDVISWILLMHESINFVFLVLVFLIPDSN